MADHAVEREAAPQVDDTVVAPAQLTSIATHQTDPGRKFIRTARASFRVKEVYAAAMAIEDAVAGQGGFVIRNDIQAQTLRAVSHPVGDGQRLQLTEYTMRGSLVVRVPSDRSITVRAALIGSIASGASRIREPLDSLAKDEEAAALFCER